MALYMYTQFNKWLFVNYLPNTLIKHSLYTSDCTIKENLYITAKFSMYLTCSCKIVAFSAFLFKGMLTRTMRAYS